MSSNTMEMVLVEDNGVVRKDIKDALLTRYSKEVTVHELGDWPQAMVELPELLKTAHLVLSDINLKDNPSENPPNNKYLRTEFDGLRIFGLAKNLNASIPVILYTAHDLAQHALDQCNKPSGPLWVIRKNGYDEVVACVNRLASVAVEIVWGTSLKERQSVYKELSNGNEQILESPVQNEGGPTWRSVLTVIYAAKNESATISFEYRFFKHKALAEVLSKFLPSRAFKFSLLGRMIKPKDFLWLQNSETFGIKDPAKRVDDTRSAWEQLIHPMKEVFETAKDKETWRTAWRDAIEDAEGELIGSRFALLESTVETFQDCLEGAQNLLRVADVNESRFNDECARYFQGQVRKVNDNLRGSWAATLNKVSGNNISHADFLGLPFCAEWGQVTRAIQYIWTSCEKHSDRKCRMRFNTHKLVDSGQWRIRIMITDEGPGIKEFAGAFIRASKVIPTENLRVNHKLHLAQGALWGYCNWLVLTKRSEDSTVRFYDVFGLGRDYSQGDEGILNLAQEIEQQKNGTAHVLDFICPLPSPQYPEAQNLETMDLR